jgi:hypothetical protein
MLPKLCPTVLAVKLPPATPVPVTVTVSVYGALVVPPGRISTLLVITSESVDPPGAVGANVKLYVQLARAAMVLPQFVLALKPAPAVLLNPTVAALLALFVMLSPNAAELPSLTSPKLCETVDNDSPVFAAVTPVSETVIAVPVAGVNTMLPLSCAALASEYVTAI